MDDNTTDSIYQSGEGYRLFEPETFGPMIAAYIAAQQALLAETVVDFRTLVEVGCGKAEFFEFARQQELAYLGIDPVASYLTEARKKYPELAAGQQYRLRSGVAEELDRILAADGVDGGGALLFFPFNSIGNMKALPPVAAALARSGMRFLVASYDTESATTEIRRRYYANCNYTNLRCTQDEAGVVFSSDEGLRTVAYHPGYFRGVFEDCGLTLRSVALAGFGVAYTNVGCGC